MTLRSTSAPPSSSNRIRSVRKFSLQWHITNRCELSCRHCYDRSTRGDVTRDQGAAVIHDLVEFCSTRGMYAHVTFTGGNPFLHPEFFQLYEEAVSVGCTTSVLANPVPRSALQRMVAIRRPELFQVSLEGLKDHNDYIRGEGHFARAMCFLEDLKALGISSAVMITATEHNLDQIIPLAERLNGLVDNVTFSRLCPVGNGQDLSMADPGAYRAFLERWVDAAQTLSSAIYKDNLVNLVLHERGATPFPGCTGFGCSAALSTVALLPDGQVHACRRMPSLIGNIYATRLSDIYGSDQACAYRSRPEACRACPLTEVCGGCPAVTRGIAGEGDLRDPYCWRATA